MPDRGNELSGAIRAAVQEALSLGATFMDVRQLVERLSLNQLFDLVKHQRQVAEPTDDHPRPHNDKARRPTPSAPDPISEIDRFRSVSIDTDRGRRRAIGI